MKAIPMRCPETLQAHFWRQTENSTEEKSAMEMVTAIQCLEGVTETP